MARLNLKNMSVADLVALRDRIQAALADKIEQERSGLQKQIDALTKLESVRLRSSGAGHAAMNQMPRRRVVRGRRKPQVAKARKVEPKYRGPGGETWTGRGNAPRWLAALEADGKKRESYLIKK